MSLVARQEFEEAIARGTTLSAWSADQLTGFLAYKQIQHGALWVSYCVAETSEAFWHLMREGRQVLAPRIHFRRRKYDRWTTRRWIHAMA